MNLMKQEQKYQEEINWHDLIYQPKKLFGYSYVYMLIVLVGIGLLYAGNLNTIGKNAVAPVAKDTLGTVNDIPLQSPRIIPPLDVMKAGVASKDAVAKGKELYKTNCASCHGDNGTGDGAAAAMLNPKPRNFTVLNRWKNGSKVSQMYKTLDAGISGSAMASFNFLSPADRFMIIHYIRTLASIQTNDSPEELKQLDAVYQLSKGINVTGQIPIRKATALVLKESAPELSLLQKAIQRAAFDSSKGAMVFRSVVENETKAFTVLFYNVKTKKNVDDLIATVAENPIQSGFKPSVARLSTEKWNELYQYAKVLVQ
jgi:mono/diheme cytochrome c family protein